MANLKYAYKLTLAYITRFKLLLFLGIIVGIGVFFLINYMIPLAMRDNSQIIGLAGKYHTDSLPHFILDELSDGLTKINENGEVEPSLASSWETPDKGKTWIFHLRENIFWHDGSNVKSSDITYEFSDVEIDKPDDLTIIFKLQNNFSPFPGVVSRPTFKKGLLGTGHWRVEEVSLSGGFVQILETENDEGRKKIYKFYPTIERTKLAYKLGEVNEITEILDPSPFNTWKTAKLEEKTRRNQVVTLFFNTSDKYLSEKNVRQALVYAIDKEKFGERAISPISPDSWVFNPQVKKYIYDKQRAKELLDELPDEAKKDMEIKLISTTALLPQAESIAKDWEEIGVKTRVLVTAIVPSEFQVYLAIYDIPLDPDQYSIWHSTQKDITNISKYSSPRVDKLLEEGRTLLNSEDRRNTYLDFQRFLLEDVPAGFLYHPKYYTISRN